MFVTLLMIVSIFLRQGWAILALVLQPVKKREYEKGRAKYRKR